MEKYKFKVGDRVRITKIDDLDFYGNATYNVGDVGTIVVCSLMDTIITYCIEFDKRQSYDNDWDNYWAALESWLEPAPVLINYE